ncbi:hypothetical protein D3C81_305020 [compost metagenome]
MNPSAVYGGLSAVTPILKPQENDLPTLEECRAALNPQFVKTFDATGLEPDLLREFVFALDVLHEIINTPGFVSDRLCNSPDIERYGEEAVNAFNTHNRALRFPARQGITVTKQVMDLIQELYDYHYPRVIHNILRVLRMPGIDVSVNNLQCHIGVQSVTAHPLFGIINYQDLQTGVNTNVPFLLDRLEDR